MRTSDVTKQLGQQMSSPIRREISWCSCADALEEKYTTLVIFKSKYFVYHHFIELFPMNKI